MKRIMILGNGRSGSSMLGMMLGSHPEINNVGEVYHLVPKFISRAKAEIVEREGLCGVCIDRCPVWGNGAPFNGNFWRGSNFIVDTSKIVSWAKSQHADNNVLYLRTTRSVYDRFGSFKNKKGHITKAMVKSWIKHEQEITSFLKDKSHFKIKYEDLCQKKGLREICDWLGIGFFENMYDFWETRHHPIRGNNLTNMMVKLHHGLITEKDLSPKEKNFMNLIGFSVKYVDRSKHLTKQDIRMIKKTGADKINNGLGYEG